MGVPLTLLQLGVHQHTGVPIDAATIANNFLVAQAIYGPDRAPEPTTSMRLSALVSTGYYLSEPNTLALACLVPVLHTSYKRMKPYVAPVKPFVVSALWTAAIYGVPVLRDLDHAQLEPLLPSALFLSMVAFSHTLDVVDIEEDERMGIQTPAAMMGEKEAKAYAIACCLAASLLHTASPFPNVLYDAISLGALFAILVDQALVAVVIGAAFVCAYVNANSMEIANAFLQSTESSHKLSIGMATSAVQMALHFPQPYREMCVDTLFALTDAGDAMGHQILQLYEAIIRHRMR